MSNHIESSRTRSRPCGGCPRVSALFSATETGRHHGRTAEHSGGPLADAERVGRLADGHHLLVMGLV
jgi:hypothetical protein